MLAFPHAMAADEHKRTQDTPTDWRAQELLLMRQVMPSPQR
jgi:hypothetical protein